MLNRLLRMGIGEVVDRSRQEASKWVERTAVKHPGVATPSLAVRLGELVPRAHPGRYKDVDPEVASRQALERFRATGHDRFFAGAVDPQTPRLVASVAPEARDRMIASAEKIQLGRFDLLGYHDLSFGDPVDWRLDPVSGRSSSLVHWSSIDPTDVASVGDCKVVWELSRLQFLVTLGVAYRATGDERHAAAFANFAAAWMRENPTGLGINWVSSLEVALRIVSWCWALHLFRASPHLTPDLFSGIIEEIEAHASHIERYLSNHSSPNTHLTGEGLGLFYAGALFPESSSADRWRALGQGILNEQIRQQVLPDGVYFEQATAYQIYTIDIYLHYLMLAARNDLAVPANVGSSVERMLEVLLSLRRPDGGIPAIGDQDGGSLLPLNRRTPDDARGVFATAAVLFGREDLAWAAERVQPEALWLLGPAAIKTFEAKGAAPPRETSRVFADGGYVVMRSSWQRLAHHLIFDVGPLGCPLSGAHGHADLLSVIVSPFGEGVIVDPGTYAYSAEPAFREHLRSTRAHSTVVVDGLGQAESKGPFSWRDRPTARLRRFLSTPESDFADASHDAYARLKDPVVHRRRVAFVKSPGYWVIVDDLAGSVEHRIEQRFQFAALPVTATSDSWVRAAGSRGRGLLVRTFTRLPVETRIESGSMMPIEGWIAPNYGQRLPAPVLVFSTRARLPLRLLTLLFPVEDSTAPPPRVRPIQNETGDPVGLVFEDTGESIRFDDDAFTIESAPPCKV